jgi:NAD(P)-dependent dehydrogenase (short-subunit alcohol dehydrogenase family)
MTALGRVGAPDVIGPMVASLLGPDNRWVTGQPGLCVRPRSSVRTSPN